MIRLVALSALLVLLVTGYPLSLSYAAEAYSVQVGEDGVRTQAMKVARNLVYSGIECEPFKDGYSYKVLCGRYMSPADASPSNEKIGSLGYDSMVVRLKGRGYPSVVPYARTEGEAFAIKPAQVAKEYSVQVGGTLSKEQARKQISALLNNRVDCSMRKSGYGTSVICGKFPDIESARPLAARISSLGYRQVLIVDEYGDRTAE